MCPPALRKDTSESDSHSSSPRPSFQSATELHSRSLNDVSALLRHSAEHDRNSRVSLSARKTFFHGITELTGCKRQRHMLRAREHPEPQSQPLTPPPLRNRLLRRIRLHRQCDLPHGHDEYCDVKMGASSSQSIAQRSPRRERGSTQMHSSSEDETPKPKADAGKYRNLINSVSRPPPRASDEQNKA